MYILYIASGATSFVDICNDFNNLYWQRKRTGRVYFATRDCDSCWKVAGFTGGAPVCQFASSLCLMGNYLCLINSCTAAKKNTKIPDKNCKNPASTDIEHVGKESNEIPIPV